MNNKGVGVIFCLIAAMLLGARYIAAAMFMSSTASWSAELFAASLAYVGPVLLIAAVAALAVGVCFLAAGLIQDQKNK